MLTSSSTQAQPNQSTVEMSVPEPGHLLNTADFALAELPPQEIWNRIVTTSVRGQASDIHMTFQDDQLSVAVRADGQLCPQGTLPNELGQRLVGHIKVAADLDPSEKRRPQDGHIACVVDGRPIDLRIAILCTNHGESIAVRIQDRETSLLELEQLGMSGCQTEASVDTDRGSQWTSIGNRPDRHGQDHDSLCDFTPPGGWLPQGGLDRESN